jgi:hypothetical protein
MEQWKLPLAMQTNAEDSFYNFQDCFMKMFKIQIFMIFPPLVFKTFFHILRLGVKLEGTVLLCVSTSRSSVIPSNKEHPHMRPTVHLQCSDKSSLAIHKSNKAHVEL